MASVWNPSNASESKKGVDYIEQRTLAAIDGSQVMTPSVVRVQKKIEAASVRSILNGALSTHRVNDLASAASARKVAKDSNKIVQKYGEFYGHQALRQIREDNEDEARVVNMREGRA